MLQSQADNTYTAYPDYKIKEINISIHRSDITVKEHQQYKNELYTDNYQKKYLPETKKVHTFAVKIINIVR